MNMNTIITYGIIYLLVFRLAVLLLGGLCIFSGYRLFLSVRQQAAVPTLRIRAASYTASSAPVN